MSGKIFRQAAIVVLASLLLAVVEAASNVDTDQPFSQQLGWFGRYLTSWPFWVMALIFFLMSFFIDDALGFIKKSDRDSGSTNNLNTQAAGTSQDGQEELSTDGNGAMPNLHAESSGDSDIALPPPITAHSGTRENPLSLFQIVGLSAGGVLGSGWLLAAPDVYSQLGSAAVAGWLVGFVVMGLVAVAMVEFGIVSHRTGGLLFHPQDTFGPLVVITLAAALWISYAVLPAAQAAAVVTGISDWLPSQRDASPAACPSAVTHLTLGSSVGAVAVLILILGTVLIPRARTLQVNAWITVGKVFVAVLIVGTLALASHKSAPPAMAHALCSHASLSGVLESLVASGIIYAYIGFQAPLDVVDEIEPTGRIRRDTRVRVAVYGTVAGSWLLYSFMQLAYDHQMSQLAPTGAGYSVLVSGSSLSAWATQAISFILHLTTIISPFSSGIVFAYALKREIRALSSNAYIPTWLDSYVPRRLSETWQRRFANSGVLIVTANLVVGLVALIGVGGNWRMLTSLNTVPILVVYAASCLVLVVRADQLTVNWMRNWLPVFAYFGFVGTAVVIYESDWSRVWRGVLATEIATVALLLLPLLRRMGIPTRWVNATPHIEVLSTFRSPAAHSFIVFTLYIAAVAAMSGLHDRLSSAGAETSTATALVLAVASVAFVLLIHAGRRYVKSLANVESRQTASS